MDYEIVKYEPIFKSQVLELQTHLWSPDLGLNAAYLEWKYENNPFSERPTIYMAMFQGRVVGMRGICGAMWQADPPAQQFMVPCAADLVIEPNHRNQGIFSEIMRPALEDVAMQGHDYVFNLGASPVTFFGSLASGWRSPGSFQTLICKSEQTNLLGKIQGRLGDVPFVWRYREGLSSFEAKRRFLNLDKASARRRKGPISVERFPRIEEMARLVERLGSDGRIRQVRSPKYLTWRFQNPLSAYRFLYWEETQLEGYMVVEQSLSPHANRKRVNIVDWEGTHAEVRADLLRKLLSWGEFNELAIWSIPLSEDERALLLKNQFSTLTEPGRMIRYRPCVLVRPAREEMLQTDWTLGKRRLMDLSNWDLRQLYVL